ncbi:MAG TPA: hypothetical protein VEI97_08160 [bacterium]|nr:hypothetical protein [bacterium]
MKTELLLEILERLRRVESLLIGGGRMALITNLEARINSLVDRINSRYGTYLPFKGKYLQALRVFLLANLDTIRYQVESAFERGDVHLLIDYLINFSRGNLPLPFYYKPLAGMFLEGLRIWLHRNTDVFKDQIGALPNP